VRSAARSRSGWQGRWDPAWWPTRPVPLARWRFRHADLTVGLIGSETASNLRTLTATGAGGRTRRPLSGVTAGTIGLPGAGLGTVTACLAAAAWAYSSLTQTLGSMPWSDIGLLVIGMPLIGAAADWLLGGRAPSTVSRQSLE